MKTQNRLTIVVAVLLFMIALAAVPAMAAEDPCAALVGSTINGLPQGTAITSASVLVAGTSLTIPGPAPGTTVTVQLPFDICQVLGSVGPEVENVGGPINFALWMPLEGEGNWNGRFDGVGNGGLAGSINYGDMFTAIREGYATASTDTGHSATQDPPLWAESTEFLIDFASRAIHVTAQAAKAIIGAYYGQGALQYSYFTGCSDGGGQALFEAQRYPDDYDGIVAGAPANYPTHMWPAELYPALVSVQDKKSTYPDDFVNRLNTLYNASMAACDGIDGILDGLIDDPRLCHFDPATLLCTGTVNYSCLTADQVEAFKKMYAGLKDPFTGQQIFPPQEPGSENLWFMHIEPMAPPAGTSLTYFEYMILKGATFDWTTFNLANPYDYKLYLWGDTHLGPILDAINPDLSGFKARKGKLIMYHGWADQLIAPLNSVNYYNSVVDAMSDRGNRGNVKDFLRLFMVPGMNHCSGGPGPTTFDSLGALVKWVEQGTPPDVIIGSNPNYTYGELTGLSRPLCPYPEVARWDGSGAQNVYTSFSCVPPIDVSIEPKTISLSSQGQFSAFITVPKGFNLRDWGISDVTCQAVSAVSGMVSRDGLTYTAKFNIQDLKGVVSPGPAVTLTVKLDFNHNGKVALTQGSDTVRIIP
jgi:feruloyl esterase